MEALKERLDSAIKAMGQAVTPFSSALEIGFTKLKSVFPEEKSISKVNALKESIEQQSNGVSTSSFTNVDSQNVKENFESLNKESESTVTNKERVKNERTEKISKRRHELKNEEVKVESLYVADAQKLVPKLYTFGYDFNHWNEYWAILNTGELYLGLPQCDSQHFNYEQERRQNPQRFLPYRANGNVIYGFEYNGREISFQLGQESVLVDSCTTFKRVNPCNNFTLEGIFRHESYSDPVECAASRGLPGQTSFYFSKEGQFKVKGCTSDRCLVPRPHSEELRNKVFIEAGSLVRSPDDNAHYNKYNSLGGKGSYSISENQITLLYDDGRTEEAYFFKYPGNDGLLSINGVNYFKDDR